MSVAATVLQKSPAQPNLKSLKVFCDVAGRVSVASIYSIGLSHMNRFVQRFLQDYPKANVRVQYQHPHRVYELVETDQIDLGLVSYPRSSRMIRATLWREEPMVLVCAPGHRLAG